MSRPEWDYDYLPLKRYSPSTTDTEHVVATLIRTAPEVLSHGLEERGFRASVTPLIERAPLFWYRVGLSAAAASAELHRALENVVPVRYAAPATRGSLWLGAESAWKVLPRTEASDWAVHPAREHQNATTAGFWFLGPDGVDVDRAVCGTGAGTRLAVIDDNARDADTLDLDAEIPVGVSKIARSSSHGTDMVAWATRSHGRAADNIATYTGVAPDASTRLYCIPKAGKEVHSLALALVRAVSEGADVIVCATYVEGSSSPMLDDALEFAARSGRSGRGTAVLFPAGREVSSPAGSVHASLTLALGDPACDPRVLCVAPSGRDGTWFLWTDRLGARRPFSNRGPAVTIAAPGDDMASPHLPGHRIGHAESSGASAIAAGVALLVLGQNPEIGVEELYALLEDTAVPCSAPSSASVADPMDLLPLGRDADGHDARCGYGRVSALRACLAAMDPIARALVAMGEDEAARRWQAHQPLGYSATLARWAARAVATDTVLSNGVKTLLRHLRLLSGEPRRAEAQDPGALLRALVVLIRRLDERAPDAALHEELRGFHRAALEHLRAQNDGDFDATAVRLARELWPGHAPSE